MNEALFSLLVIVVFSLIGGFFAAAETALVTLRESQIRSLSASRGRRGVLLGRLASNPNRFLAAVQVGVTLTGFVSAGYGASNIVPVLAPRLEDLGVSESIAETVSFIFVTIVIAYIALVIGELVPKRIALQRTEGVALGLAAPVEILARVSRPFIWLLSASTNLLIRLVGLDPDAGRTAITNDELRKMVASHKGFSDAERQLIDDVFDVADRDLREVMLPRTEVAFLNHNLTAAAASVKVVRLPHSRYPVVKGSADEVIGFVHVRDVLNPAVARSNIKVEKLVREVARFPWSKKVLPALQEMRDGQNHMAIVVDEFGGTAGIVTLEDLVEELVGDIRDEYDEVEDEDYGFVGIEREVEVDGLDNLDDFADRTKVVLPDGPYETVAGYIMFQLGHLPEIGDSVPAPGCLLRVTELDGKRASKVQVVPMPE